MDVKAEGLMLCKEIQKAYLAGTGIKRYEWHFALFYEDGIDFEVIKQDFFKPIDLDEAC